MRSYLIVANQTLTSRSLADAIAERLADGPNATYVVVPLVPVDGRFLVVEDASRTAARERLDEVLARLRDLGAEADGEVGDRDPVAAVRDALRGRQVDEIIVSTLPKGISRWLGEDVPSRLRESVSAPVVVVTRADEAASSWRLDPEPALERRGLLLVVQLAVLVGRIDAGHPEAPVVECRPAALGRHGTSPPAGERGVRRCPRPLARFDERR